jgi:hypothetical protein
VNQEENHVNDLSSGGMRVCGTRYRKLKQIPYPPALISEKPPGGRFYE